LFLKRKVDLHFSFLVYLNYLYNLPFWCVLEAFIGRSDAQSFFWILTAEFNSERISNISQHLLFGVMNKYWTACCFGSQCVLHWSQNFFCSLLCGVLLAGHELGPSDELLNSLEMFDDRMPCFELRSSCVALTVIIHRQHINCCLLVILLVSK